MAAAFIAHSSTRALAGATPRFFELSAFVAVERVGRFARAAFGSARFRERVLRRLIVARRQVIAFAAQFEPLGRERPVRQLLQESTRSDKP